MEKEIVRLEGVCCEYDGQSVLENIHLAIHKRDFIGITGPNGGGKTTLVRCLLGLKQPQRGSVRFLRPLTTGYLPQISRTDRHFPISVEEVVLSGLQDRHHLWNWGKAGQQAKAMEAMQLLEITHIRKEPISHLSGGQMQRTLFARAIVGQPELLILDEPTTYADQPFQALMQSILSQLSERCAIVMISHDSGILLNQARRIARVSHTLTWL